MTGWRAYQGRKFRKAIAEFLPLETLPLRDRGPQFLLGLAYAQLGEWEKARQAIRGLVRHRTRMGLLAEAMWAMAQGAAPEACSAIQLGIETFPEDSRFRLLRGRWRGGKA